MTSDGLAGFAALRRLSPAQRAAVSALATEVSFAAGRRLFTEGQPAGGCWLIRTGLMSLTAALPARDDVVLQTVGPGEVLGWSWMVPPHRWHFSAVAQGPVTAVELDTALLRMLAEQEPELGYPLALGLMEALLARLQNTRARLLDLYGSPREH